MTRAKAVKELYKAYVREQRDLAERIAKDLADYYGPGLRTPVRKWFSLKANQ